MATNLDSVSAVDLFNTLRARGFVPITRGRPITTDAGVRAALSRCIERPHRGPGRPKGSRNKPKAAAVVA